MLRKSAGWDRQMGSGKISSGLGYYLGGIQTEIFDLKRLGFVTCTLGHAGDLGRVPGAVVLPYGRQPRPGRKRPNLHYQNRKAEAQQTAPRGRNFGVPHRHVWPLSYQANYPHWAWNCGVPQSLSPRLRDKKLRHDPPCNRPKTVPCNFWTPTQYELLPAKVPSSEKIEVKLNDVQ